MIAWSLPGGEVIWSLAQWLSWPIFRSGMLALSRLGIAVLAHLVNRKARHHDDDFSRRIRYNSLASQSRVWGQSRCAVEQVLFFFGGFAEQFEPLLHNDVTSGTGAVAAARMLQVDAVPEHYIQNRAGLSVVMERRFSWIELNRAFRLAALKDYSQSRHRK
jgi:hypothetical protein